MPPKQAPTPITSMNELQDQMEALMARLEAMQMEINALRSDQSRTETSAPSDAKEPIVSKPEHFSSTEDDSNVLIFLQQCELSFELQPSRFPIDYQKVGFILNYL